MSTLILRLRIILFLGIFQYYSCSAGTVKGPRISHSTHRPRVSVLYPTTVHEKICNGDYPLPSADTREAEFLKILNIARLGPTAPFADYSESLTTTEPPKTRWRGTYMTRASWRTPYALGSSNQWRSMHKNVNKEYSHQWYEFIYSTEESDPYYSHSYKKTSCFWKKVRNTRSTLPPHEAWKAAKARNRSRFLKRKRAKAHEEWKARNAPVSLEDTDYNQMVRRILCPEEALENQKRAEQRLNPMGCSPTLLDDDPGEDMQMKALDYFWTQTFGSAPPNSSVDANFQMD